MARPHPAPAWPRDSHGGRPTWQGPRSAGAALDPGPALRGPWRGALARGRSIEPPLQLVERACPREDEAARPWLNWRAEAALLARLVRSREDRRPPEARVRAQPD